MSLAAALGNFQFLRPAWLLGLLALPVLAWWWRRQARARNAWREAVDAHLLPHLLDETGAVSRRAWAGWLAALGLALAIIALAGPSLRQQERPLWQTRAPLVVALDLSETILARDLAPSRLAQARAKLATLLSGREGGQVALVVFSGDAYTVAPLTEEAANVALFLDALAPDVMPDHGGQPEAPRVDRGIAWAQGLLRQAGFDRGDILVLTDRADGTDAAAARKALEAGYRVSVMGLGSARGGMYERPGGGSAQARLDAPSLQRLAASGGGRYLPLAAGDDDLRTLGLLDPRDGAGMAAQGEKVATRSDDGYWLLPVALLLCLPLFRRGGLLAAVLACVLWLPPLPGFAQTNDAAGTLWRRADQLQHMRMQEGVAAYRAKDYPRAIERFAGVPGADGQYNLGNALAKAGRYDEAIAAYDRALAQQPGMPDALVNKRLVELAKKMPKREQPQGQDGKQGQPPQQPGGSQASPAQSGPGDGKPPRQPQSRPQPTPQEPAAPPTPADAQAQQDADAAQRRRIGEALRRQQGQPRAGQSEAAQPRPETAQERERRLANQAWLQRVPDDPGALLRARFRLEAQRRRGEGP